MKAFAIPFLFMLPALAGAGGGLMQDCWFYAGFDGSAAICGGAFPEEHDSTPFVGGRYGKGCHFHYETENRLPPMAEFLGNASNFIVGAGTKLETGATLRSSGGVFTVRPRAMSVRSRTPWNYKKTAYTCSFYVKGRAGDEVRLKVVTEPLRADELQKIERSCKDNFKKPSLSPMMPDVASNAVWKLDGTWQRVYAYARFDHRARFTGRRIGLEIESKAAEFRDFQFHQSDEYPRWGRFNPSVFIDGGKRRRPQALATQDAFYLRDFPAATGSCVAWVRAADKTSGALRADMPLWGFVSAQGGHTWRCSVGSLQLAGMPPARVRSLDAPDAGGWLHVAWTWSNGTVRVYQNGRPCRLGGGRLPVKAPPAPTMDGKCFAVGGYGAGGASSDAVLDDVAVFSRVLDEREISRIASSRRALFSGSRAVLMRPFDFTVYFRNQTNAALRTVMTVPQAGDYIVRATIGDRRLAAVKLRCPAGETRLAVPFDPALYSPGRYPFEVRVEDARGARVAQRDGFLEVKGRLERDAFRVFSWGGWKKITPAFHSLIGVNDINSESRSQVRENAKHGFFTNIRYENSRKMDMWDYDVKAMAQKARRDLLYAEGLHTWVSTLVNSEVYGAVNAVQLSKLPWFNEMARREIGCEGEWSFIAGTDEVDFRKLGEKRLRGVIDGSHRTFRSLYWFMDRGMPVYRLNAELAKTVHGISPDNTVWTEPLLSVGGIGKHVDMMADWVYEHDANVVLSEIREQYGYQRALSKPYQPTVSMYYYPKMYGSNPVTGKGKVDLCQSADELIVKSWMSLAAVRTAALGIFAADYWQSGVENAALLAADPKRDVSTVADPDAPERYGDFIRSRYMPAAELLRDMENVTAPVAFLLTGEARMAGGYWWGHYWYRRALCRFMCLRGIPFDVIQEHAITAENLKRYRYVVYPMSAVVTKEHDRIFTEAATAGVRFVLDDETRITYPNAVKPGISYSTARGRNKTHLERPFLAWITNVTDTVRGDLAAWSEQDGAGAPDSYTFVKSDDGVKYVTVVNNKRRSGGSILTRFHTNALYRPVSTPSRITTHFKTSPGAWVYTFDRDEKPVRADDAGRLTLTRGYDAAEGRVFAVYPEKLEKLALRLGGDFRPGARGYVDVGVLLAGGKTAPGRQVVRLKLTGPDGKTRDESGLYRVEGTARIPLRFALDERSGAGAWKLEVKELVSSLEAEVSFTL